MVMADVGENGMTLNKDFYIDFPKRLRSHQIRFEGDYQTASATRQF
jgi:selenium-binding protein 1